jgi:hypothetical protein
MPHKGLLTAQLGPGVMRLILTAFWRRRLDSLPRGSSMKYRTLAR